MTITTNNKTREFYQNHLLTQGASTVAPTRLTVNSREYLTAPAVLIVAGVLNQGLIEDDTLVAEAWNHIPIVINHPRDSEGTAMSARNPEVLAQYGVGTLYRARLSTGQRGTHTVRSLQAELWLDCAQVEALGGEAKQALTMLETQTPLEISTGFYADAIPQLGSCYGVPYTEILTNIQPDHLALLPNDIGACNWAAGCGSPRLHVACAGCDATHPCSACAERIAMPEPVPPSRWQAFIAMLRQFVQQEDHAPLHVGTIQTPTRPLRVETQTPQMPQPALVTEQTDADVRESLYGALAREMEMDYTPVFIDSIDTAQMAFVYRQGERLLQRRWTVDAAGILTLDANTEDVQRDTRFVPVPGTQGPADDEPEDSNQDLPGVMAAFATTPRCPECQGFMSMMPDATGTIPPCPNCGYQPSAPVTNTHQERHAMTQPVVSPVAIKARVNNLITNKHYGWGERDRAMLESMPEATLIRLESQPVLVAPPEPTPAPEPPKTAQEAISQMPTHLQDMFGAMYRDHQERRQAALAMLLAHKSCPFEQEELQEMSVDRLEKLVAMGAGVDYSGRGLPPPRVVPEQEEMPPPPPDTMTLVLERQKALGLR